MDLVLLTSSSPITSNKKPSGRAAGRAGVLDTVRSQLSLDGGAAQYSTIDLDLAAGIGFDQHILHNQCAHEQHYREWFTAQNVLVGRLRCQTFPQSSACLNIALSLQRGMDMPRSAGQYRLKIRTMELSEAQQENIKKSTFSKNTNTVKNTFANTFSNTFVKTFSPPTAYALDYRIRSSNSTILPEVHICGVVLCMGTGRIEQQDTIVCNAANAVDVLLSIAKSDTLGKPLSAYALDDKLKGQCWERLQRTLGDGLHKIRQAHIQQHTATMQRTQLHLPLPVDALLFQMGRYLLLASASQGVANLQGLWADGLQSAWNGDYHLNINMQMIYWPTHSTSCDATFEHLLIFLERLAISGRPAAQILGASSHIRVQGDEVSFHRTPVSGSIRNPAWMAMGFTDSRLKGEILGGMQWAFCVSCGAWMATHLWEHLQYSAWDTSTLTMAETRIVPVLRGVVCFFLEHFFVDTVSQALVCGWHLRGNLATQSLILLILPLTAVADQWCDCGPHWTNLQSRELVSHAWQGTVCGHDSSDGHLCVARDLLWLQQYIAVDPYDSW